MGKSESVDAGERAAWSSPKKDELGDGVGYRSTVAFGGGIGIGEAFSSLGDGTSEGGSPELIWSTSEGVGGGYPPNFSREEEISLTASCRPRACRESSVSPLILFSCRAMAKVWGEFCGTWWRWVTFAMAESAERKTLTRERASSSSRSANQESMGMAKVELVRAVSSQVRRRTVSRQEEKEERDELEEDMMMVFTE